MSKELDAFTPQRRNVNKHTKRGMAELEQSMHKDGWIGAITAAADGEIFDGSARRETVETALNADPIVVETDGTRPVIIKRTDIPNASDPRAIRLGVAANKIAADNLSWDADEITALWLEDESLFDNLFTDDELAAIRQEITPDIEIDAPPKEQQATTCPACGHTW